MHDGLFKMKQKNNTVSYLNNKHYNHNFFDQIFFIIVFEHMDY